MSGRRARHAVGALLLSLVGYPHAVLAVAAIVAALAAWGTSRIRPASSLDVLLSGKDDASRALVRITEEFAAADVLIALVTDQQAGSAKEVEERLKSFARQFVAAVESAPSLRGMYRQVVFQPLGAVERYLREQMAPAALYFLDEPTLKRVLERLSPAAIREQMDRDEDLITAPGGLGGAVAKAVLRDPLRLRELVDVAGGGELFAGLADPDRLWLSEDGRTLMIQLLGERPVSDLEFAKRMVGEVEGILGGLDTEGLEVRLTGSYAIAATSERCIRGDMIRSITMSMVLLQVLFLLVYRHLLSFAVLAAPVVLAILTAFGLASLVSAELTPLVAVIGAILAGLGIDYSVHFFTHYGRERAMGAAHRKATGRVLVEVGPAMLAACVTSLIGFLAIGQSSVEGLRQFALVGVVGLGGALVAAVTLLPALLEVVGRRSTIVGSPRLGSSGFAEVIGGIARRFSAWACAGTAVALGCLGLALVHGGGALAFETDLTSLHPQPNEALAAQEWMATHFGHPGDPFVLHLSAADGERLVALAHDVEDRLHGPAARAADIGETFGLGSLVVDPRGTERRRTLVAGLDAERILAEFEEAVGKSCFAPAAFEEYRRFLREVLTPREPPTIETLRRYPQTAELVLPRSALRTDTEATEALALVYLDRPVADRGSRDRGIEAIRALLGDLPGVTLTGMNVVGYETERVLRREVSRLAALAGVGVALWLLLFFRKPGEAALAFVPTAFGGCVLLGVMSLLDVRLNLVNLIGLPLLIGIGVDNGIFLVGLSRDEQGRRLGRQALVGRLGAACHAVMMTTLTTLLTFGTLVFTSTPAIRSLGLVLLVGMSAALAGAVGLLGPWMIRRSPFTSECPEPAGCTDEV